MMSRILVALCVISCVLAAEDLYTNSDVTILTDKNFHSTIDTRELALVEFYAPWCGHCKTLAPTYTEVATKLKDTVLVAAVDATKESATGAEFGVKGFPTISIFSHGKRVVKEYSGERTVDAMVSYMKGLIETKGVPPSASAYDDSDVVVLTDKNFDTVVKQSGDVFVEFYAPWCGHCQTLTPIFKEVATKLKDKVVFAALESTEFEAIADKYNVQGYPTLIHFRDGEVVEEYSGEHSKKALVDYFRGQKVEEIVNIESEEDLTEFLQNDVVVLAHFQKENDVLRKTHKEGIEHITVSHDGVKFGLIEDVKLAKKLGWHFSPAMKLYRKADKFEAKFDFFKTSTNVNKVRDWVVLNMFSPLSKLDTDQVTQVHSMIKQPMLVYFSSGPLNIPDATKQKLVAFANTFNNDMNLLWVDHTKADIMTDLMLMEINPDPKKEFIKIITDKEVWSIDYDNKQSLDEAVTEFFTEWMNGDKSGGIERFIPELSTSEGQNPEDVDQEGPVFNLIASIFEQTVEDSAPDFFIEFYAPWCGHCKALAPVWDALAEQLADTDVVVAKMDATANDIPGAYKVEGFPTLMYIKKLPDGKRERIEYSGGRELADLKAWVLKTHESGPHNKRPAEPFSYYPAPKPAKDQENPLGDITEEDLKDMVDQQEEKINKIMEDRGEKQEL